MERGRILSFFKLALSGELVCHFFIIFSSLFDAIYTPAIYWCVKVIIDTVSEKDFTSYAQLKTPIVIFITLGILETIIRRFGEWASLKSEPRVIKKIILNTFRRIQSYKYKFFVKNPTTLIVTKIKGLVDGYENLLQDIKNGIFFNFLAVLSHSIPIYIINKEIGGFLIFWAIIFVLLMYIFSIKLHKTSKDYNNSKHNSFSFIGDKIENIESIKGCEMEDSEVKDLEAEINNNLIEKDIKLKRENLFTGILSGTMYFFVIVFVLFLSLEKKKNNEISIGDLTFIFTVIWDFLHHLKALAFQILSFWVKLGDVKSSAEIITDQDLESKGKHTIIFNKDLPIFELNNIFYFKEGIKILDNISLKINNCEKVAIVGFNGAGKSSLIKIMLGIKQKTGGDISFCGQKIEDKKIHEIRKMICFVPQKIKLFNNKSILYNITYSIKNPEDEKIQELLKEIGLNGLISKLPTGLESIIGVDVNLSPGEEQQIFIARTILLNKPILILDEATSSTDAITEMYIQRALNKFTKDKTVISIAHRLNTIRNVDRIIVIHKGKIEQMGTHDELSSNDGMYKQLLNCSSCPTVAVY